MITGTTPSVFTYLKQQGVVGWFVEKTEPALLRGTLHAQVTTSHTEIEGEKNLPSEGGQTAQQVPRGCEISIPGETQNSAGPGGWTEDPQWPLSNRVFYDLWSNSGLEGCHTGECHT